MIGAALATLGLAWAGPPDKPAHPDPSGAMQVCAEAQQEAGSAPIDRRMAIVVDKCAPMFVETGCQEAFRQSLSVPAEARISTIMEGCRDAYCPVLASPKPALCDGAPDLPTRLQQWPPFLAAVQHRDLGVDPAEVERIVGGGLVGFGRPVVSEPAP